MCNAASIAFGIPVAALDVARVAWPLQVRPAQGTERTHPQSGNSAVREATTEVLIAMEAMHPDAREDVDRLAQALGSAIRDAWGVTPVTGRVTPSGPVFSFA